MKPGAVFARQSSCQAATASRKRSAPSDGVVQPSGTTSRKERTETGNTLHTQGGPHFT